MIKELFAITQIKIYGVILKIIRINALHKMDLFVSLFNQNFVSPLTDTIAFNNHS